MTEYATYRLKITTLTPLHIGSGAELLNEYDYAIYKGQTWRINDAALLEEQAIDDPRLVEILMRTPPARLLRDSDYDPTRAWFRYVIRGTPRSQGEGAVLREQIKDIYDQPFLPGSSLKGALRTVLAWKRWEQLGLQLDPARLGRSKQWAAQEIEGQLFGPDPNHSLLRALQISDSQPVGVDRLLVLNVRVVSRSGKMGAPIELEALRGDSELELTAKLDLALFSEWAKNHRLNLKGQEALLALPEIANEHARVLAQGELSWLQSVPNTGGPGSFYQQLLNLNLAPGQFLLQLGWGTGWNSKTLGSRLEGLKLIQVVNQYRMSRFKLSENARFPASRRFAMRWASAAAGEKQESPGLPLGWVLATLEPLHGPKTWMTPSKAVDQSRQPAAPTRARPEAERAAPSPTPAEPPQLTSRQLVIERFSTPPVIGDRFRGEVFELVGKSVLLAIPGLEDTQAYALISLDELPHKPHDGDRILCEVIGKEQEANKTWRIRCRGV